MSLSSNKERELIGKAKRGREAAVKGFRDPEGVFEEGREAFNELWKGYEGAIRGLISSRLSPVQRDNDLQDLVSKTAWEVWEKIHTYDPDRSGFYTWVCIWARIIILRYFTKQDPLETEILIEELRSAAKKGEWNVDEVEDPPVAVTTETPEAIAERVEKMENFLRVTFNEGGYPHQLNAFGFIHLLEWEPREIVNELRNVKLRELAKRLEDDYIDTVRLERLRDCFTPFHQRMGCRLREIIPSGDSSWRIITAPGEESIGGTKLPNYWGGRPEANLSSWRYRVFMRVCTRMAALEIDC